LTYAITKENKHNSRINIYGNDKIVINSPEVWFEITRQYAKVGCKNLIIFSYKNHCADPEERLSWLRGGSAPDLAVAVSSGGHGGAQAQAARLGAGCKGSDPFMGDVRACLRPKDRRRHL
jgi:hypothetical protein